MESTFLSTLLKTWYVQHIIATFFVTLVVYFIYWFFITVYFYKSRMFFLDAELDVIKNNYKHTDRFLVQDEEGIFWLIGAGKVEQYIDPEDPTTQKEPQPLPEFFQKENVKKFRKWFKVLYLIVYLIFTFLPAGIIPIHFWRVYPLSFLLLTIFLVHDTGFDLYIKKKYYGKNNDLEALEKILCNPYNPFRFYGIIVVKGIMKTLDRHSYY